jgi:DNA-binding CsgD family transcriptional regulator
MQRLGSRDLRAFQDSLRMTYATLDLDAFPRQVIAGLRRVVSAPFGSYNEIDHQAAKIKYVVEPAGARVSHLDLIVGQYLHEQPVVANYRKTGDGSPRKLSDFLTRQEFHHLNIYNENYRRTGVEYQMIFMFRSLQRPSRATIAIALDRGRGDSDFTEHDRFVLKLFRPHVVTAYANAQTVSAFRCSAAATNEMPETRPREIVVLRRQGRHLLSPRAASWLAQYFGRDSCAARTSYLPDDLQRWVRRQALCLGRESSLPHPAKPLIVEREHSRLSIRLIPDPPEDLLLLEEEREAIDYAAFERRGLTSREAEVLHWIVEDKTNRQIATILHTSCRTVEKHLENIFAKLGVRTRTAAATVTRTHV